MQQLRLNTLATPLLSATLLCGALSACTGTVETPPPLRLVMLTENGSQLSYLEADADTPQLENAATLSNALQVLTTDNGRKVAIITQSGVQQRDQTLNSVQTFDALPFEACLKQGTLNADRTQLLVLSECSPSTQRLALYSLSGRLIWTATLPLVTTLPTTPNLPPTRIAMLGNTAIVSRAALGTGSEIIRVTQLQSTDTQASTSSPQATSPIYDLLTIDSSTVYAATSTGVRALIASTGLPDLTQAVRGLTGRYDRLWSSTTGSTRYVAAWTSSNNALRFIDRQASSPELKTVGLYFGLRDLTFSNDGFAYFVTDSALYRLDNTMLFASGSASPRLMLSGLKQISDLAWVIED